MTPGWVFCLSLSSVILNVSVSLLPEGYFFDKRIIVRDVYHCFINLREAKHWKNPTSFLLIPFKGKII